MRGADRDAGNYWELPDGEKQNRCPRVAIHENPDWWGDVSTTYSAYEKGFLPSQGGIDDQPALLVPIMATISSALDDERELKQANKGRTDQAVAQSQGGKAKPVSVLNGPSPDFAHLTPPKRE
jgi:hypothetical protein